MVVFYIKHISAQMNVGVFITFIISFTKSYMLRLTYLMLHNLHIVSILPTVQIKFGQFCYNNCDNS